jgi:hypothetical protein
VSDTNLNHLERSVRERWHCVVRDYHAQHGRRLEILVTCTYRPPGRQAGLVLSGASRRAPGTSRHNVIPCYALDFLLRDANARMTLEAKTPKEFAEFQEVGEIAEGHGFIWGGRWRWIGPDGKPRTDPGHVEAPITVEAMKEGAAPDWPEVTT